MLMSTRIGFEGFEGFYAKPRYVDESNKGKEVMLMLDNTGILVYLSSEYNRSITIYNYRFTCTKCTRVDDTVHLPVGNDEMVDVYPFTYEKGRWILCARTNTITTEQSMEKHREYIRKLYDNGCIVTL